MNARAAGLGWALAAMLAGLAPAEASGTRGGGKVHFLALGDSYTIGESVDPASRWPEQLAVRLREAGHDCATPEIVARTGWTTAELAGGIAGAKLRPRYDLVSLLIGVNNQFRGLALDEYRAELHALLAGAIRRAGGNPKRVLVISIPDWGVTPFAAGRDRAAIASAVDSFNAVNRAEAAQAGARWVDVTGISRLADREPALVAGDGLHPSAEMYRRWVERVLPEAEAALGRP
jgi:lysophospholipase L1-like esterase